MKTSISLFLCALVVFVTWGEVEGASFRIYKGSMNNFIEAPLEDPMCIYPHLDKRMGITIYVPGFNNDLNGTAVAPIMSTYISLGNTNVILLNWQEESKGILPNAGVPLGFAPAILIGKKVASSAGKAIVKLIQNGIPENIFRLVGHSLGAHMAGWIGEEVQKGNYNISSVCGLDPSGPAFGTPVGFEGIKPSQASLVHIIHTHPGRSGISEAAGHIDFWVNCDIENEQPGCPTGINAALKLIGNEALCSHFRVLLLMIEALRNPGSFPAASAKSCSDWKSQNCSNTQINYFGSNPDASKQGNFYFSTNGASPYSKGICGTKPN